ncbi:hypothetical protein CROQUDRAFT_715214 [Cronartium quercuum f. sp. fusiforme G11]|uniref:Protein kinase domain-containing protein n=1 Tax=Cronartium quercuum f. sp. fusiforme G11 TaxID=708437 RepID=A0A9P6NHQ1_9BASI|nr:hypothetical protein CROQUDRAFT_715214 [Cronartium quercuum f. sp. fusiforme G11]
MKIKSSITKRVRAEGIGSSSICSVIPPLLENLTVKNFKISKLLGEGGFSVVKKAYWKSTGKPCALKILDDDQGERKLSYRNLEGEVNAMNALGRTCAYILQLQGVINYRVSSGLVLALVKVGDLFLNINDEGGLSEELARFYLTQMACALEFLQSKKTDDILITTDGYLILTDFGLAIFINEQNLPRTPAGAYYLPPPEMLRHEPYTYAVDWYALGLNLYEMLTNRNPFEKTACLVHHDQIHTGYPQENASR